MTISTSSCGSLMVWGGRAVGVSETVVWDGHGSGDLEMVGNCLILTLLRYQSLFRHQSWLARSEIPSGALPRHNHRQSARWEGSNR